MIWLGVAAVVVLIALLTRRARFSGKPAGTPSVSPSDDLLTQAEEATFEASVRHKKVQRESALTAKPLPASDPTEEILWNEQQDVYRPAKIERAQLVRSLRLDRAPQLRYQEDIIVLRREAYSVLRAHLASDLQVELGGLLVGQAFFDRSQDAYLILVEAALAAKGGEETATSFHYTADAWAHIVPEYEQHPEWTIVGSYHSHPGLGVFLSATDLQTQRTVFSQDWQVALVVDPVADNLGFFVGTSGKPCTGWYLDGIG